MKHLRGQTFTGKAGTSSFECCEMLDGRPWTYQTDLFGLLGTVHVLLIGKYMNVFKELGRYRITANIKRLVIFYVFLCRKVATLMQLL